MSSFNNFFRSKNSIYVVPTLKPRKKMNAFYNDKDTDRLKLGCTLPNLEKFCLHKSTDAKFIPFTEGD